MELSGWEDTGRKGKWESIQKEEGITKLFVQFPGIDFDFYSDQRVCCSCKLHKQVKKKSCIRNINNSFKLTYCCCFLVFLNLFLKWNYIQHDKFSIHGQLQSFFITAIKWFYSYTPQGFWVSSLLQRYSRARCKKLYVDSWQKGHICAKGEICKSIPCTRFVKLCVHMVPF